MASTFGMTAGNNHFRKLDACFHSSRVAGEARVKKFEKASQPLFSLFAKRFDLLPIGGATQNRTKRNYKDVQQKM
jgi:hypothetical protein